MLLVRQQVFQSVKKCAFVAKISIMLEIVHTLGIFRTDFVVLI